MDNQSLSWIILNYILFQNKYFKIDFILSVSNSIDLFNIWWMLSQVQCINWKTIFLTAKTNEMGKYKHDETSNFHVKIQNYSYRIFNTTFSKWIYRKSYDQIFKWIRFHCPRDDNYLSRPPYYTLFTYLNACSIGWKSWLWY